MSHAPPTGRHTKGAHLVNEQVCSCSSGSNGGRSTRVAQHSDLPAASRWSNHGRVRGIQSAPTQRQDRHGRHNSRHVRWGCRCCGVHKQYAHGAVRQRHYFTLLDLAKQRFRLLHATSGESFAARSTCTGTGVKRTSHTLQCACIHYRLRSRAGLINFICNFPGRRASVITNPTAGTVCSNGAATMDSCFVFAISHNPASFGTTGNETPPDLPPLIGPADSTSSVS